MYRLKILIGALLVSMLALGGVVTAATTSSTNVTASVKTFLSRLLQFQAGTCHRR